MDTNQNNKPDNYQINSFTRGMNSDTSYDMVGADQYLFGLNIRITNNTLIAKDTNSNTTENVVFPVYAGKDINVKQYYPSGMQVAMKSILATASIENVGAIVVKDITSKWHVFRANLIDDEIHLTKVFSSTNTTNKDRFSVVINNELYNEDVDDEEINGKDVLKLYIADGDHPVMCVNLNDPNYYKGATEDWLISNRMYPTNRVKFVSKIQGSLKTQQVQYTYRFYKKYGVSSKLAPITNKINVIDSNRNKEIGNAEDTLTSVGFKLKIEYTDEYSKVFDHILIFRISYIKHGENAEINLIYDAKLSKDSNNFELNDTGIQSLAKYTIDEFSALNGTTIYPEIIEQNQNYLFAGNISDDSQFRIPFDQYNPRAYQFDKSGNVLYFSSGYNESITDYTKLKDSEQFYLNKSSDMNLDVSTHIYDKDKYFGGTGPNISWRFVTCEIPIDATNDYNLAPDNQEVNTNLKLYYITSDGKLIIASTVKDYFNSKNVFQDEIVSYNEMFTSSLLRSLRRDEVYRYGVVFYDQYGTRSDVLWIADIKVPDLKLFNSTVLKDGKLYARPLGIEFVVKRPITDDGRVITSYLIVRCEKSNAYTKNLLLVAMSRPSRQGTINQDSYRTPYYPNVYLSTQFFYTVYGYFPSDTHYWDNGKSSDLWKQWFDHNGTNVENNTLYLILSPEINIARKDLLSNLSNSNIKVHPLYYAQELRSLSELSTAFGSIIKPKYWIAGETGTSYYCESNYVLTSYDGNSIEGINDVKLISDLESSTSSNEDDVKVTDNFLHRLSESVYLTTKYLLNKFKSEKIEHKVVVKPYLIRFASDCIANVYNKGKITPVDYAIDIKNISDVKNPLWNEGFSDVQLSGEDIAGVVKQYKSFTSNIGTQTYVNWVANGMYDMPATKDEVSTKYNSTANSFVFVSSKLVTTNENKRSRGAMGWIGPGPVCFVINTEEPEYNNMLSVQIRNNNTYSNLGTICANIQHTAVQFAGLSSEEKQYDVYYGFGNFGKFNTAQDTLQVFDGEIYIVPAEFVNMFKTYDFNDIESTILSGQVVYYIPLESKINTFFDYGMNYKNTGSANLLLEPGIITGVTSQDRPLHLYNMIYSDNNTSNDVFSALSLENYITSYKQRIHYSLLKTNGESIDNWQVFKPADFIDTDSRHGQLTELFTVNDVMYFWLNSAFGKLSVNERSLVTDNNNNTIQLGQGGVLQRTDYINTRYGMREQDYSVISAEGNIYWIDSNNRTVVLFREGVVNYCEYANVLNITNENSDNTYRPHIDYDILNLEVLCKFLTDGNLLIFSSKLGVGTSIYTRDYESTIQFNNVLYGLKIADYKPYAKQYNYLTDCEEFLTPVKLSFVVNSSASQTKVFDNQKIVTLKRVYIDDSAIEYMKNKQFAFTTDICGITELNAIDSVTDREGNVCYTIPRFANAEYGNRIRGKWMKVDIVDNKPNKESSISHIITKFRQSYS